MKTITGLLVCLFTALALAACSGDSQGDSPGGSSSTETGEVAALVNDEPITLAEVKKVARNFVVQGLQPDLGAQGDTHEARMYYTVVDRLIEQKLINQEVAGRGVVIGDDQVAQGVNQLKAMAGGEQAFQKVLSDNNITIEDVERDTRTNLAVKNFYEKVVPAEPTVSEDEIMAFYHENAIQWESKPEVHARHILIRTQPGQDDMARAEIRRRAAEVLKIVQETPDFAAVARDHSEDETTAPTGGDLSWFGQGRMVPPFDSAAFALEPGEVSGLVETQFGYHIIKVEETRMSEAITLGQVRPQIQAQLTQQKGQEAFVKAVQDLRAAAKVEVRPPSAEVLAEMGGS